MGYIAVTHIQYLYHVCLHQILHLMNNSSYKKSKLRFIGKSLIWSVLLYILVFTVLNISEIKNTFSGEGQYAVVYTNTQDGIENIKAAKITIDSLHNKIGIASKILNFIKQPLD